MNRYVSLFVLSLIAGSVFGMGSGTGGGGSGSSGGGTASGGGSNTSQIGEGGRAVRLYDQGVRAMKSKKFAEARARFAQALTENPRFAEAHNYLGYSLQMEGTQNYPMALEHYNRAIQLKPNLAQAYEYRGALLLKMHRKSAAEKDLATLKRLNPGLAVELERIMKKGERSERVCGETRRLDPLINRSDSHRLGFSSVSIVRALGASPRRLSRAFSRRLNNDD